MRWFGLVGFLAACADAGAPVEGADPMAQERRRGDRVGTLECALPGGDIELETTCAGARITSCTDQVRIRSTYAGGWSQTTRLSGTDNTVQTSGDPLFVTVTTTTGSERFAYDPIDCTDADGDGFIASDDCDDGNAAVHPGAAEICNGLDDDCDPATSEAGTAATDVGGTWTDVTAALTPGFVQSVPQGSALHLCAGTWRGTVRVEGDGAGVVGHAESGPVTIDANRASQGLVASGGGNQYVSDVTITGATDSGVTCTGGTALHLSEVWITDNAGSFAGGVFANGCSILLSGGGFSDNIGADAGAAYLNQSYLEAVGSDFLSNSGNVGGVLAFSSTCNVVSSVFDGNVAFVEGRDLWAYDGAVNSTDSDFGPNSSVNDTSAINLRYVPTPGQGAQSVHYGAGTFQGSTVGNGRDFSCSTSGTYQGCSAILP